VNNDRLPQKQLEGLLRNFAVKTLLQHFTLDMISSVEDVLEERDSESG